MQEQLQCDGAEQGEGEAGHPLQDEQVALDLREVAFRRGLSAHFAKILISETMAPRITTV